MSQAEPDRGRDEVEEKGYRPVAEGYRPTRPAPQQVPEPPTSSGGASPQK